MFPTKAAKPVTIFSNLMQAELCEENEHFGHVLYLTSETEALSVERINTPAIPMRVAHGIDHMWHIPVGASLDMLRDYCGEDGEITKLAATIIKGQSFTLVNGRRGILNSAAKQADADIRELVTEITTVEYMDLEEFFGEEGIAASYGITAKTTNAQIRRMVREGGLSPNSRDTFLTFDEADVIIAAVAARDALRAEAE